MEPVPSSSRLRFADATLVPVERQLLKHGQLISLTPKAFDLLVVLAENPGRLLTKDQLMEAVWGDTAVEESNLAYHISAIRKALGDTADNGHLIETVPKRGYRFTAAVTPLPSGEDEAATARDLPRRQPSVVGRVDNPSAASSPPAGAGDGGVSPPPVNTRDGWRSAVWIAAAISVGVAVGAVLTRGGSTPGGADLPPAVIRAQIPPGDPLVKRIAVLVVARWPSAGLRRERTGWRHAAVGAPRRGRGAAAIGRYRDRAE